MESLLIPRPVDAQERASGPPKRDIVVQCAPHARGTAAWCLEISFVEWNNQTFSVFVGRSNGSERPKMARYATFKGPLTWRRVLHYLRRSKALAVGFSFRTTVRVVGVPRWQETMIATVLARTGDGWDARNATLLATLPDTCLEKLFASGITFTSEGVRETLWRLRSAIRATKNAGVPLPKLATALGVADPTDFHALIRALGETPPEPPPGEPPEVIYWRGIDELVFATVPDAERLSQVRSAISTSRTWGEFKSRMPADDYDELIELWRECADVDDDDAEPPVGREFTPEEVPGYVDGDYPKWLQQCLDDYLPIESLSELGELTESVHNGSFWEIPASSRAKLLKMLTSHGYRPVRRRDLQFF